ncbi:uncharacterized protein UTRI_06205 [Ustilago trichophora]|uniref:Uncharacterized protein n=1 Tax=Ustilago trichophora TaxID=86804 RepID=A0A5C3EI16_9BASI|nr:uncharacterized protein UTRI_06205 [Ustilago trichophora]
MIALRYYSLLVLAVLLIDSCRSTSPSYPPPGVYRLTFDISSNIQETVATQNTHAVIRALQHMYGIPNGYFNRVYPYYPGQAPHGIHLRFAALGSQNGRRIPAKVLLTTLGHAQWRGQADSLHWSNRSDSTTVWRELLSVRLTANQLYVERPAEVPRKPAPCESIGFGYSTRKVGRCRRSFRRPICLGEFVPTLIIF